MVALKSGLMRESGVCLREHDEVKHDWATCSCWCEVETTLVHVCVERRST